jgi:glucan phosphoethanolaminetransferase (alkaline phosphatase superfamily)
VNVRSQAAAALGPVILWLLINNMSFKVSFEDQGLGQKLDSVALKQLLPESTTLVMAGLVATILGWLLTGLLRRIVLAVATLMTVYLTWLMISLNSSISDLAATALDTTTKIATIESPITYWISIGVGVLTSILFLFAIKARPPVIHRKAAGGTGSSDIWKEQDKRRGGRKK